MTRYHGGGAASSSSSSLGNDANNAPASFYCISETNSPLLQGDSLNVHSTQLNRSVQALRKLMVQNQATGCTLEEFIKFMTDASMPAVQRRLCAPLWDTESCALTNISPKFLFSRTDLMVRVANAICSDDSQRDGIVEVPSPDALKGVGSTVLIFQPQFFLGVPDTCHVAPKVDVIKGVKQQFTIEQWFDLIEMTFSRHVYKLNDLLVGSNAHNPLIILFILKAILSSHQQALAKATSGSRQLVERYVLKAIGSFMRRLKDVLPDEMLNKMSICNEKIIGNRGAFDRLVLSVNKAVEEFRQLWNQMGRLLPEQASSSTGAGNKHFLSDHDVLLHASQVVSQYRDKLYSDAWNAINVELPKTIDAAIKECDRFHSSSDIQNAGAIEIVKQKQEFLKKQKDISSSVYSSHIDIMMDRNKFIQAPVVSVISVFEQSMKIVVEIKSLTKQMLKTALVVNWSQEKILNEIDSDRKKIHLCVLKVDAIKSAPLVSQFIGDYHKLEELLNKERFSVDEVRSIKTEVARLLVCLDDVTQRLVRRSRFITILFADEKQISAADKEAVGHAVKHVLTDWTEEESYLKAGDLLGGFDDVAPYIGLHVLQVLVSKGFCGAIHSALKQLTESERQEAWKKLVAISCKSGEYKDCNLIYSLVYAIVHDSDIGCSWSSCNKSSHPSGRTPWREVREFIDAYIAQFPNIQLCQENIRNGRVLELYTRLDDDKTHRIKVSMLSDMFSVYFGLDMVGKRESHVTDRLTPRLKGRTYTNGFANLNGSVNANHSEERRKKGRKKRRMPQREHSDQAGDGGLSKQRRKKPRVVAGGALRQVPNGVAGHVGQNPSLIQIRAPVDDETSVSSASSSRHHPGQRLFQSPISGHQTVSSSGSVGHQSNGTSSSVTSSTSMGVKEEFLSALYLLRRS